MASLGFVLAAAALVFWDAAPIVFWDSEHRRSRRAIAFAIALVFLATTMIWRLVWIEFYVLP